MGTRDLVDSPQEWVFDENGNELTPEQTQEEKSKQVREQAETRVRNALCLPEGEELSESQKALATQYERVIRNESLTPKTRVPEGVMTNGRFSIDARGRKPYFKE
jgi:hypothetical protein